MGSKSKRGKFTIANLLLWFIEYLKQDILKWTRPRTIWLKLKEMFGLDTRSLAMFRFFLGMTQLFDLYDRARDLNAHYTDEGIMPRSLVLDHFWNYYWFGSIYMISGTPFIIAIVFILNAIAAFCFMIGYRTKLFTFVCWFFLTSIQNRNIIVGHSGDWLHKSILVFSMFLPLGDAFSVDRALNPKKKDRSRPLSYNILNMAALAYHSQICIMYYTANIHKSGAEWNELGTATWLALQYEFFRRSIADPLLAFPYICKLLTWSVHGFQAIGWHFFFIPILSGPFKMFGVFGYFCMHLGFAACLRLGHFGWITCVVVLGLIPSWAWDNLFYFLKTSERTKFKLYYTSDHVFSRTLAKISQSFFLLPGTEVSPYQIQLPTNTYGEDGSEGKGFQSRVPRPSSFWLIAEDYTGKFHFNFEAVFAMMKVSPFLLPLHWILARARSLYKFTEKSFNTIYYHTATDAKEKLQQDLYGERGRIHNKYANLDFITIVRLIWKICKVLGKNAGASLIMFLVVTYNMGNIGRHEYSTPNSVNWMIWAFQVEQYWGVFAPRPPDSYWWYNIHGELDNGTEVELWANGGLFTWEPNPSHWEKPNPVYISFKNHRWFKYYENGLNTHPNNDLLRLNFGRWICREFNKRHYGPHRLWKFDIFLMNERLDTQKMDGSRIFTGKYSLWGHLCYEKK